MESVSSKHYDVLIVGAGVIGLSIAYHVKETNPALSVLVVDRKPAPAQGDTAKSMAAVRDMFTSDANQLLASSSIDFYKHVETKLGFDLNLELIGYLWLLSETQFQSFESIAPEMIREGIQFKVHEPAEVSRMIPDLVLSPSSDQSKLMGLEGVYKAVHGLKCGTVAPDLIAKFYETEYRKLNGEFQLGIEAKKLRLVAKDSLELPGEPYIWQEKSIAGIETTKGPILADTTIVALGARTATLFDPLGIDCYVKPKKRQIFQFKGSKLDGLLNTKGFNKENTIPLTILPKSGVLFRPVRGEKSIWVTAADDVGRAFSIEEDPVAEEDYFTMSIYPILSEYFPCFTNLRPATSWAGFYDVNSLDGTPVVDRIDNCILATGMSGSGIMKADAIGRLAAALYYEESEATLFGNRTISTTRLGLVNRNVGHEQFVI